MRRPSGCAAIPAPLQNEALPTLLMEAPDGLQKYLNIWDSGEDAPDEFLGADEIDDGYDLTWLVPVEFVVAGGSVPPGAPYSRQARRDLGRDRR